MFYYDSIPFYNCFKFFLFILKNVLFRFNRTLAISFTGAYQTGTFYNAETIHHIEPKSIGLNMICFILWLKQQLRVGGSNPLFSKTF